MVVLTKGACSMSGGTLDCVWGRIAPERVSKKAMKQCRQTLHSIPCEGKDESSKGGCHFLRLYTGHVLGQQIWRGSCVALVRFT